MGKSKKSGKKSDKHASDLVEGAAASKAGSVTDALRLPQGPVDLSSLDTRATPTIDLPKGSKSSVKDDVKASMAGIGKGLSELQERLFAAGRTGSQQRLLLVLQGMDTSGKGGVLRHSVALVDPQGVQITSFKAPTPEEQKHDFLWRIRRATPEPGMIGVFDRSHYEDVLIGRVRELSPRSTINGRYDAINRFEEKLVEDGCTVIKCMLHISPGEQKERLRARLESPDKHWKFNPGDIDERGMWPAYQEAYEIALERTNTDIAPWYVIPSDRKWYRNWAVTQILHEYLARLDLEWPEADFDVAEQLRRLDEEDPLGGDDA